ncbi:DNA polymerase III subunit epsilon [Spirochaetia bacterium]|nr:DNA polymerase III subunit epsilon [Spirochaetia bacterium]GHV49386.1 DNA polymerase III subunit epsilon [Spirochaetia bacterium]
MAAPLESYDWALEAYRGGAVFTAFDIETTGLDAQKDRIVELGAVKFDNRGPISRFNVLIDPGIPMPEAAGRVNNITDKMLAGQPSLEEVLPDFLRLIKDSAVIAHNAPFDYGFINQNLKESYGRTGGAWVPPFPSLPNRIADTLVLCRRVFPGRSSYKLQELAAFLQIKAVSAHRAEDDARLCMEIFIACAKPAIATQGSDVLE